jgi:mono/diheme cytochrome c family protein
LLAFSLGGTATLPRTTQSARPYEKPAAPQPKAALARAGKAVWDANGCEICHGVGVVGGIGSVPDLRRINSARLSLFSEIVRGGLLKANGMPIFADSIAESDLPALKAYIVNESWRAYRNQPKAVK